MRKTLISFGLALSLGACTALPESTAQAPVAGETAPEFNVVDQQQRSWSVLDSHTKPILVDLWATWCSPCLQALPDLQRFAKAHASKITVLGLATDQQGWPVVTPVIKRYEIEYPVAVINPALSEAFGAKAYPYLVVLHQGKVVKRMKGRHSYQDLELELAPWLQ